MNAKIGGIIQKVVSLLQIKQNMHIGLIKHEASGYPVTCL